MESRNDAAIRPVRPGELEAVALLRWRWMAEAGGEPAASRGEFVAHFAAWAEANAPSHRCLVAVRAETVVGMAWLAVTDRVPHPGALVRASGDVQCVYVVPGERGSGLGSRLIDAVVAAARESGLERVTVHSSDRAVPAYARRGFAVSPRLLQAEPVPRT
ncbi:GNAT family N-acetyltransferase [Streptomyces sp. WMMB 714]|uniref:GNAT family N-acetyltransferase n=1 Tax=Streptomyces sp. WMMB 714 TaxID=1286822 RepID=UPI0005F86F97|nr:GNAT family N-acetyltransferase [Streptomyces sp. WMMB 714]